MSNPRLLKCYGGCEGKYPKEQLTKHKGKNYCEKCLEKIVERDEDYDKLCKYICEVFKSPYVNPYIKKQINDFEAGGFTLRGMRSTLWYITNILKIRLDEKYGISMVRYKYYEAKKFAEERNNQRKQVEQRKELPTEVKYVNVDKFRNNKLKKRVSLATLDLEKGEDGDGIE